jgi:hypothetical protein
MHYYSMSVRLGSIIHVWRLIALAPIWWTNNNLKIEEVINKKISVATTGGARWRPTWAPPPFHLAKKLEPTQHDVILIETGCRTAALQAV